MKKFKCFFSRTHKGKNYRLGLIALILTICTLVLIAPEVSKSVINATFVKQEREIKKAPPKENLIPDSTELPDYNSSFSNGEFLPEDSYYEDESYFEESQTAYDYSSSWNQKYNYEAKVVKEIEEKRDAKAKHFLMDDGSYTVVQYSDDIHYKVGNTYKEIDNQLIKTSENVLENADNRFKVKLPATYGDEGVSINYDEYNMSFKMVGYSSLDKKGEVKNKTYKQSLEKDASFNYSLKNKSSIAYTFEDVNLEYEINGTSLKENIIVNKEMESYVFSFEIVTSNLILVLDKENNISALNNKGELIFTIPAGYMFDSTGASSNNVDYTLEKIANGYLMSVIPEEAWIKSESRVFPITIDPMVVKDSWIYVNSRIVKTPTTTGPQYALPLSNYNVAFLKFTNLPILPLGSAVVDAKLKLTFDNRTGSQPLVFMYECDKEWSYPNIPTNFYFDTEPNILPDQQILVSSNKNTYNIDITRNVKNWLEYGKTQFGFAFRSWSADDVWIYNANAAESEAPCLEINYRINIGLEAYWDYDVVEFGHNDIYINKYNNQTTIVSEDITLGGELPISLQHIYLSAYKDSNYNVDGIYSNVNYGYGWKINYQQIIRHQPDGSFKYYDADGTLHMLNHSTSTGKWYDEDGLGLEMITTGSIFTMTDKNRTEYLFDYHGRLFKIEDKNGNVINIIIGNGNQATISGLPITEINDGKGRSITLSYNAQGYLTAINYKKYDGVTIGRKTFTYTDNRITGMTWDDDTYIYYEYFVGSGNSEFYNGVLNKMQNENNNLVVFIPIILEIGTVVDGNFLDTYHGLSVQEWFHNDNTHRNRFENLYLNGITLSIAAKEGESFVEFDNNNKDYYFTRNMVIGNVYDNYGRLVSGYVSGPEITTSVSRRFTAPDGAIINNNKITATTSYESNVVNYLKNYNFENDTVYWQKDTIYSGTEVYTNIASSNKYSLIGQKSLELFIAQPSLLELRAQQTVTLNAGSYVFSGYIRAFDTLMRYSNSAGNYGAFIGVKIGSSIYESDYATNDMFTVNNGFALYHVKFTLTSASTVTVYAALKNCSGFAYFDGLQLLKDDFGYTNKYNSAENAGFEMGGTTLPNNWLFGTDAGTTADNSLSVITENAFSGNCVAFYGPGMSGGANLYQKVAIPKSDKSVSYTLSAWFNTLGRLAFPANDSYIRLNYRFLDEYENPLANYQYVNITLQSIFWHQVSATFVVSPEVKKIEINIQISKSYSILLIDNVSLVQSEIMNFAYDDNGNNSSYIDGSGTTYNYSENEQNISLLKNGINEYGVIKDSKGNVISSTNYSRLVKTAYSYDSSGRVLTEKFSNLSGTKVISSQTQYSDISADFQNTVTDIDSLGFQTISNFYSLYDLLQRTTFNDGSYIEYSYAYDADLINQIKTLTVTHKDKNATILSTVIYTYNLSNEWFVSGNDVYRCMGMLKSVELGNGTKYSYIYDKWGSPVLVLLNNNIQIQYTYNSNNGRLSSKQLATGYTEYYSYDNLGRMSEVRIQENSSSAIITAFAWEYSVDGSLICMKDYLQNKICKYQYDASDRLIIAAEGQLSSNKMEIFFEYQYDNYGDLYKSNTIINSSINNSGMTPISIISKNGIMTRNRTNNIERILIDGVIKITYTYNSDDYLTNYVVREENELNNSAKYPNGITIIYRRESNGKLIAFDISALNNLNTNKVTLDSNYSYKGQEYEYETKYNIWNNTRVLANQVNRGTSYEVSVKPNEIYNGSVISNILRMSQQSFYSNTFVSLIDSEVLINGGDEQVLHYWIRKEPEAGNINQTVTGLRFRYSDGTCSGETILANTTDWQEFTIISTPEKIVTKIELAWAYGCNVCVGNATLHVKNNNNWSNNRVLANQFNHPLYQATAQPNETFNGHTITNIIRAHQYSYWEGSHFSLVDPEILMNGGDQQVLHYWIRKEPENGNLNEEIKGLQFRYSDGTVSGMTILANTAAWQEFTITSLPGKIVTKIELYWAYSSWVYIGNATLIAKNNNVWSNTQALSNQIDNGEIYKATPQPNETYNGHSINNILRAHQVSYWNGEFNSLIDPEVLINGGDQMVLHYWIRKEVSGSAAEPITGLRFRYSDGTSSKDIILPTTTDWQEHTIVSKSGKTVVKIELAWAYSCFVYIGNVRLEMPNQSRLDNRMSKEKLINDNYVSYDYDDLGRQTTTTIQSSKTNPNNLLKETYAYLDGTGNNTSYTITSKAITAGTANNIVYNYTYNMDNPALGAIKAERSNPYNIWQIKEGSTVKVQYYYDLLGRLIREDNVYANATITYTYDGNNNLTSKTTYVYTTSSTLSGGTVKAYTYGDATFKDRLTGYNGKTITYDAIGNPLNYLGKTFTWKNGRQLATWTNGSISYVYNYDSNGIRLSKTASSGEITRYLYNGTQLLRETNGTDTIWYLYDNLGIVGFELNGTSYYYIRNLQGDVTKIVDTNGNTVVTYTYDSWGKVLSVTGTLATTVGKKNPIRYRGYYYDTESNLYYLNSRYYDPETGRFISADVVAEGGNLYTYCQNDPVNRSDESGYLSTFWKRVIKISVGVVATVAAVAITVATGGAALPVIAGVMASTAIGATVGGVSAAISGGNVLESAVDGAIDSFMLGGIFALGGAAINAIKAGGQVANSVVANTTSKVAPKAELGSKLDYVFGKATGTAHNVQRSTGMASQLSRIGIHDNPVGRQIISKHLTSAFNANSTQILSSSGKSTVNSLIAGPGGFLGIQSVWEKTRLITVILFG